MKDLKTICSEKLVALNGNITAQDKLDAVEEKIAARATLDRYLKGEVLKVDIAMNIIEFMTKRVNTRLKSLKELTAA